jgi:hypothetical protein
MHIMDIMIKLLDTLHSPPKGVLTRATWTRGVHGATKTMSTVQDSSKGSCLMLLRRVCVMHVYGECVWQYTPSTWQIVRDDGSWLRPNSKTTDAATSVGVNRANRYRHPHVSSSYPTWPRRNGACLTATGWWWWHAKAPRLAWWFGLYEYAYYSYCSGYASHMLKL